MASSGNVTTAAGKAETSLPNRPLGLKGVKAFEGRGLDCETIAKFGIYTGERQPDGAVVPSERGNIIAFPFVERGRVVAEKYRGPNKAFWQRTGGKRTFWNADALDDPGLETGYMPLIVTEGEIDALTAIQCGFPCAVSVPDGAPAVPDGEEPGQLQPIDPNLEGAGKFEFLWHNRERLRGVKRFILAVDNDRPGQRLSAELVRRLSASRCMFVTYPEGCKDLNDVLMKHGPEAVSAVLNGAKPYPVRGLYRLSEYPDVEEIRTFQTGWPTVDKIFSPWLGEFVVMGGIPGHGKSAWIHNLCMNLAESYGWRSALFCPEEPTVPFLRAKLRRMLLRRPPYPLDRKTMAETDAWLDDHFVFIDADPNGEDDEDFTLEWVIERATDAVMRDGIQVLVIDPWNEVEHAKRRDESMTEYIGRSIRALKRFARQYEVMVIVAAHPTKDVGKDGKSRPPTPYDTDGSAHWYNKADHFLIVHRPDAHLPEAMIRVAKAKFQGTGEKGQVNMRFDLDAARFEMLAELPEFSGPAS